MKSCDQRGLGASPTTSKRQGWYHLALLARLFFAKTWGFDANSAQDLQKCKLYFAKRIETSLFAYYFVSIANGSCYTGCNASIMVALVTLMKEKNTMDVCYNKLFKLLIDKNMKKSELRLSVGLSPNTMAKLSNNENVSLDVIVRICRFLDCTVNDILDIVPSPDNGTADAVELPKRA